MHVGGRRRRPDPADATPVNRGQFLDRRPGTEPVTGKTARVFGLEPETGTDTLVGRGSDTYEATERYYERFGDDAVIILVRGDLSKLTLTSDLGRLLGLEGCVSGNVPSGVTPRGGPDGPCAQRVPRPWSPGRRPRAPAGWDR